jgi:hypothetical protein
MQNVEAKNRTSVGDAVESSLKPRVIQAAVGERRKGIPIPVPIPRTLKNSGVTTAKTGGQAQIDRLNKQSEQRTPTAGDSSATHTTQYTQEAAEDNRNAVIERNKENEQNRQSVKRKVNECSDDILNLFDQSHERMHKKNNTDQLNSIIPQRNVYLDSLITDYHTAQKARRKLQQANLYQRKKLALSSTPLTEEMVERKKRRMHKEV